MVIKGIKLTDLQRKIYNLCELDTPYKFIAVSCGRQVGKVQPYSTKIHTPKGLVELGDIEIGDEICGNGENGIVTHIFPHKDWDFYKITFCDGTYTFAGLEHLWEVYTKSGREWVKKVMSTEEIRDYGLKVNRADGRNEWKVRVSIPKVQYEEKELPIDPYLLGLLIGDGCITKNIGITSADQEIFDWCADKYDVVKQEYKNRNCFNIRFRGESFQDIRLKLIELGLFGTYSYSKFIPELYLTSSYNQRLELLKGLMDTDGTASGGAKEYLTKSQQLADDFVRLCKSLGFYAEKKLKVVKYKEQYLDFYRIVISADEIIFNLSRKIEQQSTQMKQRFKYQCITSIEYSHKADGACISVTTKDSTYVCDNSILTHNSSVASQIICNWCINNRDYKVGFYAPTYKQCKEQYRRMEKGLAAVPNIIFNKSDLVIKFDNGSFCQFVTADNDGMRGSTYDSIVIDEAGFVKDDIYSAGILPTVAVSLSKNSGKVLLISTPKTKNWFYEIFSIDMENKISITATSEEGGLISKDILDQIKKTTPEHIYKNEYLAEFLEEGEGVFRYKDCIYEGKPTTLEGCIAGIDFGMENDYTVLAIINRVGELVHLRRWRAQDWVEILDDIANDLKKFGVARAYAETNGIGNMPTKMLAKKFNRTSAWITSHKSKVDIINKLSADFTQGLIKIPNIDYLLTELDSYTVEYNSSTGKVTYNARQGFNDDCVMALAIANWNRITAAKRFIGG